MQSTESLLGELYREWVRLSAASGHIAPGGDERRQKAAALREQLLDHMDGDMGARFLELETVRDRLDSSREEEIFARGFRMGARMMLEVLG